MTLIGPIKACRPDAAQILHRGTDVIRTEAQALNLLAQVLSQEFVTAVEMILSTKGRIIVSGMGKSGHIARKMVATFASTGTPAQFVHPAEASHGDLGMITRDDLCLVLSNSGETPELSDLIAHTRRFSIPLIGVASRLNSALMTAADLALLLPSAPEACFIGMAPTTSTTMTLALGDALAVAVMECRGFRPENFRTFHPGGRLGAQLLRAEALMHGKDELPLVKPDASMGETILMMTAKTFGVAGLVDETGALVGIITDGDLRRNMHNLMNKTAGEVAHGSPKSIRPDTLAVEALGLMNQSKISCLFIVDEANHPVGLLRIHDCLRAGVA